MDSYWESENRAPPFLTSAPDGGERQTSVHASLSPRKELHPSQHILVRGGPRVGAGLMEKRKYLALVGNRTLNLPLSDPKPRSNFMCEK
jgi:hypothetical protein